MRVEVNESIMTEDNSAGDIESGEVVLAVNHVSKKFCRNLRRAMFYAVTDIGGELLGIRKGQARQLRKSEFWALSDVSFTLRKGSAVGIVGANGAGKTTLLKIISGLIKPDHGSVSIKGRVAPLIALGAGFNPILSGKENIFVNMSILGLSRQQIEERIDRVIEFAEIGHAIDAPVATYSSGMAARLGFSCAIHTDPDILLIDEVLAVGDMRFRAKCYRRLADLRSKGCSFILVSHSSQSLSAVCSDGILLVKGKIKGSGEIASILKAYEESLTEYSTPLAFKPNTDHDIHIKTIETAGLEGRELQFGSPGQIVLKVSSKNKVSGVKLMLIIRSNSLESDYSIVLDSRHDDKSMELVEGENEVKVLFEPCSLKSGEYTMKAAFIGPNHYVHDAVESFVFYVKNSSEDASSSFYQPRRWTVNGR